MLNALKRMYRQLMIIFAVIGVMFSSCVLAKEVTVYAAASLTNAVTEIAAQYEVLHIDQKIKTSFASSSTLAKQIENGAPVDIFISADVKWMDYVEKAGLINKQSRHSVLGNSLVLIAPKSDHSPQIVINKKTNFANSFNGKLCTGDVERVPAGMYAKEALKNLGWWDGVENRIVGTDDVRGALAFVEKQECALGIVYQTDANVSTKVIVVGVFPENTHSSIVYPFALTKNAVPESKAFFDYLMTDKARSVFQKYGFMLLGNE